MQGSSDYPLIMSSMANTVRSQSTADDPTAAARAKRGRTRVTVGEVTVSVHKPTAAEIKTNVAKGSSALGRLKSRLLRPGVRVYPKKNVPLYFADDLTPGVYLRKLNGKIDRGILEDGSFKVIA